MPTSGVADSVSDVGSPVLAACYVRMSTEHQRYSTENQLEVIEKYAAERRLKIVKIYQDAAKSGLTIRKRPGLKSLIADILSGEVNFSVVLVYDISRWGRFQDVGESTHYEFLCRRSGVSVCYCAERFENDGSIGSEVQKVVKQSMAAEYSRELSTKVFRGQANLIRRGYRQGGRAGLGLRRILVDENGKPKQQLSAGEHKSIQTDRVILGLGPEDEVKIINWIYKSFTEKLISESEIAAALNSRRVKTDLGRLWNAATVRQILSNPKYVGDNVWNRTSGKLGGKRCANLPEDWIHCPNVFTAIISRDQFAKAGRIIAERSRVLSDEEMLDSLRQVLARRGSLSGILIDEEACCPRSSSFRKRFGGLRRSYQLINYDPGRDYSFLLENQKIREQHPNVIQDALSELQSGYGAAVQTDSGSICVNGELVFSLALCRHTKTETGASRWLVRFDSALRPDMTIAARMNSSNSGVLDYYIFPTKDMQVNRLSLAESNTPLLDGYRFNDLRILSRLSSRTLLKEFL